MDEYRLSFLPQFSEDLNRIAEYISNNLMNPIAADELVETVLDKIEERRKNSPESYEPHQSKKQRQYPYYRIYVGDYVVFYVVIHTDSEPIMEVRRLLHTRQDRNRIM